MSPIWGEVCSICVDNKYFNWYISSIDIIIPLITIGIEEKVEENYKLQKSKFKYLQNNLKGGKK